MEDFKMGDETDMGGNGNGNGGPVGSAMFDDGNQFDAPQVPGALPEVRLQNTIQQTSEATRELNQEAYDIAGRKKAQEDIAVAVAELNEHEQRFKPDYSELSLEQRVKSQQRDAAIEFGISPVELKVNDALRYLGIDRFQKKNVANRKKEISEAQFYQVVVAQIKGILANERDNDPDAPVTSKGLRKQVDEYETLCRGLAHTAQKIKAIAEGLENKTKAIGDEIIGYQDKIAQDPSNEEHQDRIQYHQKQLRDLQSDLTNFYAERKKVEAKLVGFDQKTNQMRDRLSTYEARLLAAEQMLNQKEVNIINLETYTQERPEDQKIAEFDRRMPNYEADDARIQKGLRVFETATNDGLKRVFRFMQRLFSYSAPASPSGDAKDEVRKYLASTNATADRLVNKWAKS